MFFPIVLHDTAVVGGKQLNGRNLYTSSALRPNQRGPTNGTANTALDEIPSALSQENLRQLRREVVELVKQQFGSALSLSRFIPAYHAQFGKQCRVADYGFARLQDLVVEALKGIVHVVGEGPLRTIMLTHVIQVRRFTHDLLRLLKGEQKKCVPIAQLGRIYEQAFNKVGLVLVF